MNRVIVMAILIGSFIAIESPGEVRIPQGFEVVEVSSDDFYHNKARMNDCGEIVFNIHAFVPELPEVLYYDNGRLVALTDEDVANAYPDINGRGTITWTRDPDGNGHGEIWVLDDHSPRKLGNGVGSSINNHGACVWDLTDEQTCAYESAVFRSENGEISQISDFELSNQDARVNDLGQIVWTRYDFTSCIVFDWTSKIMLYSNGSIIELPSTQDTPQSPDINNLGQVAWRNFDYVEIYSNGVTETFTEGSGPSLNDVGGVAFHRWHPYWHIWVYFEGDFYQLTEGTIHHASPEINNDGEVVWNWIPNGDLHPSGVMLMRRIRNGDVNFDRQVDLTDHASFATCATGPGDFARLCRCRFADMQHDRDVDLADIALFQNTFHHPQYPGHECCDSSHGPGCNDASVESCVCAVAPDCCETNWSESCTVLVELLSCGTCP